MARRHPISKYMRILRKCFLYLMRDAGVQLQFVKYDCMDRAFVVKMYKRKKQLSVYALMEEQQIGYENEADRQKQ